MNHLLKGLQKIVKILEEEEIPYMIVGGFAVSYFNRVRFTSDIDIVLQVYPNHISKIVSHFPEWQPHLSAFEDDARRGIVFNLIDFETGVKYDFMLYKDSDYNWTAFKRRKEVDFLGITCKIASAEDLIISKLQWYGITKSEKQSSDIAYLLAVPDLDRVYIDAWIRKLRLNTHGLF